MVNPRADTRIDRLWIGLPYPQLLGLEWKPDSIAWGRMPMAELPTEWTDPDQLFTATINLMWQLHYAAVEHGLQWAADDLLVALSDLESVRGDTWAGHRRWSGCRSRRCAPCSIECS